MTPSRRSAAVLFALVALAALAPRAGAAEAPITVTLLRWPYT